MFQNCGKLINPPNSSIFYFFWSLEVRTRAHVGLCLPPFSALNKGHQSRQRPRHSARLARFLRAPGAPAAPAAPRPGCACAPTAQRRTNNTRSRRATWRPMARDNGSHTGQGAAKTGRMLCTAMHCERKATANSKRKRNERLIIIETNDGMRPSARGSSSPSRGSRRSAGRAVACVRVRCRQITLGGTRHSITRTHTRVMRGCLQITTRR